MEGFFNGEGGVPLEGGAEHFALVFAELYLTICGLDGPFFSPITVLIPGLAFPLQDCILASQVAVLSLLFLRVVLLNSSLRQLTASHPIFTTILFFYEVIIVPVGALEKSSLLDVYQYLLAFIR
jgi:hypothetical protein